MTTQNELEKLTNDVRKLQQDCVKLDQKVSENTPKDDKLAVFKSSAAMLVKKKEQKVE
jgi:hypothetical protein